MKRYHFFIAILLICAALSSCMDDRLSAPSESISSEAGSSDEIQSASESSIDEDYIEDPLFETEEYLEDYDHNNHYTNIAKAVVATEDSVYYIKPLVADQDKYLYYYDRKTCVSDVLCTNPECMHQDKNCKGYIGHTQPGLFLYDNKLYWIGSIPDPAGKATSVWALLRCSLDGSDRETVLLIDRDMYYYYQPQEFFLHRGYLYFVGEAHTVSAAGEAEQLISVIGLSLKENGKAITVFEKKYPGSVNRPHLFFAGNKIYYHHGRTDSGGTEYEICCYSIRTRKTETIFEGYFDGPVRPECGESAFWIEDGEIYALFNSLGSDPVSQVKKLNQGKWEDVYIPKQPTTMRIYAGKLTSEEESEDGNGKWTINIRELDGRPVYKGEKPEIPNLIGFMVSGGNSSEMFYSAFRHIGARAFMSLYRIDIRNQTPPELIIE